MRLLTVSVLVFLLAATSAQAGIAHQIRRAFAPYGQSSRAVCIARRESTLRTWARNGPNIGLFQINYVAWPMFSRSRLFEAGYNIRAAVFIYRRQGWRPWTTSRYC